tara:strand:+ start:13193 stop:13378 length:186 start_codon:yes stop_codon:yes gene_type:complete
MVESYLKNNGVSLNQFGLERSANPDLKAGQGAGYRAKVSSWDAVYRVLRKVKTQGTTSKRK